MRLRVSQRTRDREAYKIEGTLNTTSARTKAKGQGWLP